MKAAPQLDRLDRYVRRSFVKAPEGASRYRVTYSLEEALRLANLPGEDEGRIYCFRRVTLGEIPIEANRRLWLEKVQQVLGSLAAQAVHASDPRAAGANAIYYNHLEEALESLLRLEIEQPAQAPWFSQAILGVPPEAGGAGRMQAILERLQPPLVSAGAAAALILAAIGASDPAPLLTALPAAMLRDWPREWEGRKSVATPPAGLRLPEPYRTMLERAAGHFGWRDARSIWLASLIVVHLAPSAVLCTIVHKMARETLRRLEEEHTGGLRRREAPRRELPGPAGARPLIFDEDDEFGGTKPPEKDDPLRATGPPPHTGEAVTAENRIEAKAPAMRNEPIPAAGETLETGESNPIPTPDRPAPEREAVEIEIRPPDTRIDIAAVPRTRLRTPMTAAPALVGEPTAAAGLYFLLNALRRLGIANAIEILNEPEFVPHLLRRIAIRAGVSSDDPILLALRTERSQIRPSANAWPSNLAAPQRESVDAAYLLRIWAVAVRRWCWRNAHITVREMVHRPGLVWLTRSDLDVTMPLNEIEIRIRRAGLDIDPGWLPWFGRLGKVVRFHYRAGNPERPC